MSADLRDRIQDVIDYKDNLRTPMADVEPYKGVLLYANSIPRTDSVSDGDGDGDGSLCCEICNIRVTSAKILQRHLDGRKHKSRAERQGKTFRCELCDVTANSEIQLNIHLSSSKHKHRVAREEYKDFVDLSAYTKSIYVLIFAVFCIVLNLVILVKVA